MVKQLKLKLQMLIDAGEVKSENETLVNCWNTLKIVCDQKAFVSYQEQIEKELAPLFDCMNNPEDIDFDDEIIAITNSFIRNTGVVSVAQWKLFSTFPSIIKKHDLTLTNTFETLNLMIVHGSHIILNDSKITDMVIFVNSKSLNNIVLVYRDGS